MLVLTGPLFGIHLTLAPAALGPTRPMWGQGARCTSSIAAFAGAAFTGATFTEGVDPAKRAAYDRRSVRVRKRRRSRWSRAALSRTAIVVWASSAAIVILILAFFLRDEVTRQPASPRVAEQGQSAHIADLEREIERLQRELRQARRTGTHE